MITYIYKVVTEKANLGRNQNIGIEVYRIKNNKPIPVGSEGGNTASWYGNQAVARQIISKYDGRKMEDSYNFTNEKDVQVIEL